MYNYIQIYKIILLTLLVLLTVLAGCQKEKEIVAPVSNSEVSAYPPKLSEDDVARLANTKIELTNEGHYRESGYLHIKLSIKNISDEPYEYIKTKLVIFDKEENIVHTDWTYAVDSTPLLPNEQRKFEMMTKWDDSYDNYGFKIISYKEM